MPHPDLAMMGSFVAATEIYAAPLRAHPQTVAQTNNQNLFYVVRSAKERGNLHLSGEAMCDDNASPRDVFLWANQLKINNRRCLQFSHVWSRSQYRLKKA